MLTPSIVTLSWCLRNKNYLTGALTGSSLLSSLYQGSIRSASDFTYFCALHYVFDT